MSDTSTPFEMLASPFEVWLAPVGTAFPLETGHDPEPPWVLMGTNGNRNMTEEGVKVSWQQTLEYQRVIDYTAPIKAYRTDEKVIAEFVLTDVSAEMASYILNKNPVSTTLANASAGGYKEIELYRGEHVTEYAMVIRARRPLYGPSLQLQYELLKVVIDGTPVLEYVKGIAVGLRFVIVSLFSQMRLVINSGPLLWIGYTNAAADGAPGEMWIRQAMLLDPLGTASLVWTSEPIEIPWVGTESEPTIMTNIASHDADICFVATVKMALPHNIKLFKANKPMLLAPEVFTFDTNDKFGDSDGEIQVIQAYTSPDVWFCVWRVTRENSSYLPNTLHGLWRSTDDGNNFTFVHKGYNEPNPDDAASIHAFIIATKGPQAGRIYTAHENSLNRIGILDPDNTRCVLSYSDDNGVNWVDVLNSAEFAVTPIAGLYGYVALSPLDDGSDKVYYSTVEQSLSIGTHYYVPDTGPVLSDYPAFGVNGGLDIPFYLTPDQRLFLAEDLTETPAWLSTDAGDTYSDAAFDDITTDNIHEHEHLYSVLPDRDWLVVTPDKDLGLPEPTASIFLNTEGRWQEVPLPDLPPQTYITTAVTWVGGRH